MGNNMLAEINRLRQMSVAELRVRWVELYGEETRSRNRTYLWRRLAWHVQELRRGGLSDAAKARIAELAPATLGRPRMPPGFLPAEVATTAAPGTKPRRDRRLPPAGSTLVRKYKGEDVRVLVLDEGFEWDVRRFDSLSEVAFAITGSKWNGWLFFGLTDRKRAR